MGLYLVLILIAIAALAGVAALGISKGQHRESRLTSLAGLAFACVVAGMVFGAGERLLVGYVLLAAGIALAVADMVVRARSR